MHNAHSRIQIAPFQHFFLNAMAGALPFNLEETELTQFIREAIGEKPKPFQHTTK